MTDQQFQSNEALDEKIAEAKAGTLGTKELIPYLLAADLLIPTSVQPTSVNDPIRPPLFSREGNIYMGIFTDFKHMGENIKKDFQFCIAMQGRRLLAWIPSTHGVVINLGSDAGMEIPATGIAEILREYA